jgi:4-aminobutyrate aminotransferase-like enzyme/Ser/Thr protein kinase RdoA (MazF antagonist)
MRVDEAERVAREAFGVTATASPLPGELDRNFRLRRDDGTSLVLKLHAPAADRSALALQDAVLEHLAARTAAPRLLGSTVVSVAGEERVARLLSWLEGRPWAEVESAPERLEQLGAVVARTDRALIGFEHPAMRRPLRWNLLEVPAELAKLLDGRRRELVDEVLARVPHLDDLPHQVIHNDANELNVLVGPDGAVSGLIDFGDTVWSARVCGLAVAGAYAMQGHADPVRAVVPLVRGYHAVAPLRADELAVLYDLMRTRLAVSVCMAAWQHSRDPDNDYLLVSQDGVVELLERLREEDPDLAHFRFRDACGYEANPRARAVREHLMTFPPPRTRARVVGRYMEDGRVGIELSEPVAPTGVVRHRTRGGVPFWTIHDGNEVRLATHPVFGVARVREDLDLWRSIFPDPGLLLGIETAARVEQPDLVAKRRIRMSAALSLAYRDPLHIVGGEGAHLIDAEGNAWLDLVNNVAHVGHGHPRVVAAGQAQMARLNTNTRYLHDSVVEYARRLAATLPDPLNVCFFVNSGSEANDLALRLARTHTGREDVLVLDHAYHGNLSSLIALSPYKFNRAGGGGRPAGTHVAPLPDPYRGALGATAAPYADAVRELCERTPPAAFFAESLQSCGGQIVYPPGYLEAAFAHVRAAGGVCVADEVQVGFGRVGDAFWGFGDAVPDIVTMGKPIGNGHPLAAVVTTPEIAASFVTGIEYFNTFGGNPVSAEIGLAVLDAIETERLQAAARERGAQLLEGLRAIEHPLIGDVRGRGLFIGVELSLAGRAPATREAAAVKEALKRRGILISTDGPDDNVLKIKPPLVISEADCDRFLRALREVLP